MPDTTADRGVRLQDDPPRLVEDVRSLRINQPHKWRQLLQEKRGVKLPKDDGIPGRRKTIMEKGNDVDVDWTFAPIEERHSGRTVRDPVTKEMTQEPGPRWKEHVEKINKSRGYDKPKVKPEAKYVKEEKPTPKKRTRRTKKGEAK